MRRTRALGAATLTAIALALAVGAWFGARGISTSGFSVTLGPVQTLVVTAGLALAFLLIALLACAPLLVRRAVPPSRIVARRALASCVALTAWSALGVTFLPLKGSEMSVRAAGLSTLQLNAIGLAVVVVAGLVVAWLLSTALDRLAAVLVARIGGRGSALLATTLAAAALATAVIGPEARRGALTKLDAGFAEGGDGPRVVIVGVDGCTWNALGPLLEQGCLPTFAALVERGSSGPLRSIEPLVSPRIWTTMSTGKVAEKHGIPDFVNERGVPVNATMLTATPVWDIASAHGVPVGVVGWYVTWPAHPLNGFLVSDRMHSLLRGPVQILAPLTGESVNGRLARFGRFSFDPGYKRLDRSSQAYRENRIVDEPLRWGYLRDAIYGRIAVALSRLTRPRLTVVYYRGVDFVQHFFWRYAEPAPFGDVTQDESDRFGAVVAEYYEYQDALLARLLEAAGEDANVLVVSDHGFHARADRDPQMPELTGAHDVYGVIIASGPAFRSGGRIEGATVLDIAPTALAVLGLPVPEDMDGRPLVDAIRPEYMERFPLRSVSSYEPALLRKAQEIESDMDESIKEQLRSLGYIQ